MMKIYRRLRDGEQPKIEVARFLTEVAGFRNTPGYSAPASCQPDDGEPVTLAAAFAFVANQGDAWDGDADALDRDARRPSPCCRAMKPATLVEPAPPFAHPLDLAAILGRRTAELHRAFATPDPGSGASGRRRSPRPTCALGRAPRPAALADALTIALRAVPEGVRPAKLRPCRAPH